MIKTTAGRIRRFSCNNHPSPKEKGSLTMYSNPVKILKHCVIAVCLGVWALSAALSQPVAGRVDFRRDVQPLLKQYCIECHGPTQQMHGFRLDRRRDAMRGGTNVMIK